MQKRNVLHSPRLLELKKRKRRVLVRKIIILVIFLAAVVAAVTYILRLGRLNIDNVEVTGNKVVDAELVKAAAEKDIAGNYLWIFPKSNIFIFPKTGIENQLSSEFKRLKDITLNIKNGRTLSIGITERTGKYIWCGNAPQPADSIEQCYFLDEDGYIFDQAPYFSGNVYFKFYGAAEPGSYFLKDNFKNFVYFKGELEDMGLKPVMLYTEDDNGTENAKIFLAGGKLSSTAPVINFKVGSDLTKAAENLEAALSTEPLMSEFKNKYSSLLYIDLRFENKVYYKFSAQGGPASGGQ